MCFSASASFTASAVLAVVGVVSIRRAPTRAHVPFAAIPLLFATQQLVEGALWLVLARSPYWRSTTVLSQLFLFFALFLWPSYLPVSLTLIERDPGRKRLLTVLSVVGLAVGGFLMSRVVLLPSYACVAFQHVYYAVPLPEAFRSASRFVYLATVAIPLIVSSVRGTSLFALSSISSFLLAGALFRTGFASVWCFFAAFLSVIVLFIIDLDRRRDALPVAVSA